MNDTIAIEFMAHESMTVAGAKTDPEVLEDLSHTPRFPLGINGFEGKCGLVIVLADGHKGRQDNETQDERYVGVGLQESE